MVYLNHIVKKPSCRGQSAGNLLPLHKGQCDVLLKFTLVYVRWGSSETGRKRLTCHRPQARLPQNDAEFGSFLAGLIDSDGHFNNIPQLVISFSTNDAHLAYFVKSRIGYGQVRHLKPKHALFYVCAHILGLQRIAQLVHNELRKETKIQQYNQRLLPKISPLNGCVSSSEMPTKSVLSGHWLAGFLAGDGSFQFKFIVCANRALPEARVVLQIEQDTHLLLQLIQGSLGGYIGYRKSQDTYYYSTVSFANAAKLIDYLDHTHLIGAKMTQYILWRRACVLIQQGKHLTPEGIAKIRAIAERVSRMKAHVS